MTFQRQTLGRTVTLSGSGLHSGAAVTVTIHPGSQGIAYRRGTTRTLAIPENISETTLCTRLGEFSTIEHLMAALAAAEITDAEIEVDGPELPALGGGSAEYVALLQSAGAELVGEAECDPVFSRIFKVSGKAKIALGRGTGHWRYIFHSPERYPFDQTYETENVIGDFAEEIAPARTFGWADDLVELESRGLARGLTPDTGVVLGADKSMTELKFENEPARHKLLDAMGDLYLAGVPLSLLNFTGDQSGHKLNIEAAKHLREVAFGKRPI